jgi:hypothetical protein
MVMSCYNCGVQSFGRCCNGCPYILRSRSPQENDLRLICFKCYHELTEERNRQIVESYNALHERVRQMRHELGDEDAAPAAKKAKQSDEPKQQAAASSSTQQAKSSEEPQLQGRPQEAWQWVNPPPPPKRTPQGAWQWANPPSQGAWQWADPSLSAWQWSVPHGSVEIPQEQSDTQQ